MLIFSSWLSTSETKKKNAHIILQPPSPKKKENEILFKKKSLAEPSRNDCPN